MKKYLAISFLLFSLCTKPAPQLRGWARYLPATVADVTKAHSQDVPMDHRNGMGVFAKDTPFLTEANFLDSIRPISLVKGMCVETWFGIRGREIVLKDFCGYEILVEQLGNKYWFAIQNSLLPDLRQKNYNNPIIWYVQLAGAAKDSVEASWVFIVNGWDG